MADRSIVMVSKLKPKSLGNPKVAAGFTEVEMGEKRTHWLGVIIGRAAGVKEKKMPDDDTATYQVLEGFFEGIPTDTTMPRLRSGLCFLPGGVHELICEQVASSENGAVVEFGLKIGTQRAGNKAGYEYVTERIGEVKEADPLAELKGTMGGQLSLPATEATAEDTARPKAKAGGRRR